jgi:GT2 family glycosyltransferase
MSEKDLSVIIVNYNTKDYLKGCLESLARNTKGVDYEIVVVDNASSDGSAEMLKQEFPGVRLISNNANIGFAAANNQAIRASSSRRVLFLNPDTLVLDDSITRMLAFMDEKSDAGIIGPKLYSNAEGAYQPSIRKFTRPAHIFLEHLPLARLVLGIYTRYILDKDATRRVEWLCGAALLVKRDLLDNVGLFDENFFICSEEEDLCLRAHGKGYGVYYFPRARIVHLKGKSMQHMGAEAWAYFWKSKAYFLKKHYPLYRIRSLKICLIALLRLKALFGIIPRGPSYEKTLEILKGL